jgi:Zn-dependent protease/CBS domain-containing protein
MTFNAKPFPLFRILGIPILAHYSWLPVLPLYSWAIASALLPREVPGMPRYQYWILGFVTTGLLFASVLAHELAHAIMARAEGLGTGSITLYIFGGLATLEGQPARPSSEFKIAVVGPAASFLLGTVFFAADELFLFGTSHRGAGQVLRHVGIVNWFLAGFNILPGLPLDGGRVLRAVLWHFKKNFRLATQTAVKSGLVIAITLVVFGTLSFFFKEWVTGLWCMTVGLVIALMLGTSKGRAYGVWRVKRGTVEDVMNPDVVLVPPDMNVQDFIDKVLQNNRHTSFPVAQAKRLHGLLLLEELKSVPREDWSQLKASDVMRPVDRSMFINSMMSVGDARDVLTGNGLGRAVVLDTKGFIVGWVSLQDVKQTD